ncbi:PREDICTED: glutathione S-transferase T3-like [Camelina sativa]|uniref:Glutathione S-transferase T3-like n=1 Tax=Camelina sativa TaxID=90675 RepID=A0ABM0SL34_CAMSA|nr:PREDICTED: glutathione S-transferase T3-like [Camelina sativa]
MDLLNSQHSLDEPTNFYESFSPSIELSDESERRTRRKWSSTDDVVLVSAWLNTNKDPIERAFWRRIASYCASSPKLAGQEKREPSHYRQRWRKISDSVFKFVGCYEAAVATTTTTTTSQKSSSAPQNENNDVIKLAHEIYLNDHKVKFTMEHAWRELRHAPKWCSSSYTKTTAIAKKRRKCEERSALSSSSRPQPLLSHGEDQEAPGEDKSLLEFQMEEKLSKHKLLDTLLAKTQPLSELELALKNKLLNDLLSS